MGDWLAGPRLADLALAALLLEAALIGWLGPRGALGRLLPTLAAGGAVLLALRAALAGAGTPWVLAAMTLALAAHALDLARRLGAPRR